MPLKQENQNQKLTGLLLRRGLLQKLKTMLHLQLPLQPRLSHLIIQLLSDSIVSLFVQSNGSSYCCMRLVDYAVQWQYMSFPFNDTNDDVPVQAADTTAALQLHEYGQYTTDHVGLPYAESDENKNAACLERELRFHPY